MVFMCKKKRRPFSCELLKESVVNAGKLRLLKGGIVFQFRELKFGKFTVDHTTQYCTRGMVKSTTGLVQLFTQIFPSKRTESQQGHCWRIMQNLIQIKRLWYLATFLESIRDAVVVATKLHLQLFSVLRSNVAALFRKYGIWFRFPYDYREVSGNTQSSCSNFPG